MSLIKYDPIGVIKTSFTSIEGMPIQPYAAMGKCGTVEIKIKYVEALEDLGGFQYIILLYHFHKVADSRLKVIPFLDDKPHGIFATRAPVRPNPIGISVVRLMKIKKNILFVEDVDMLNNTPLLDIKPFIPKIDNRLTKNTGWLLDKENLFETKSDKRFLVNKLCKNENNSNSCKERKGL